MNKNVVAIVPMKAHSERVKNKNFRDFNDKPLFYWIFNTLSKSKYISNIILDTDSQELADKVLSYFPDIKVMIRPEHLRGDFVSVNKLIENVISQTDNEYFIQTHSTNPCLKTETINKAIDMFLSSSDYDSLFAVNRLQTRLYDKDFKALNHNPKELIRTQDLDPIYEENSNFYIFSKQSFSKTDARIGNKPYLFEMDTLEALDIDTENDFKLAEIVMQQFS